MVQYNTCIHPEVNFIHPNQKKCAKLQSVFPSSNTCFELTENVYLLRWTVERDCTVLRKLNKQGSKQANKQGSKQANELLA